MKFLSFCIFLLLAFSNVNSIAADKHNLRFFQINTQNGLSQNTVRSILKDEKGFIWAGTLDGLNRYDGHRIITYKPHHGNTNTLADHRIADIHQGKNGFLWVKTYKNEYSCYDPKNDIFINYLPLEKQNINAEYRNLHESSNGDIWLWGGNDGCLKIEFKNSKLQATSVLNDTLCGSRKNCRFIFEDSKNNIWIGGNKGLYCNNEKGSRLIIDNTVITKKAIECHDHLYFQTNEALIKFNQSTNQHQQIKSNFGDNEITNIEKLDGQYIVIVSDLTGAYLFDTQTNQFSKPNWAKDPQLQGKIEFIRDSNEGVWMYNNTGIVWYYNPMQKQVKKMSLIPPDVIKLIDLERYNVFIDSNELIWITTYGYGLYTYNLKTDELCNYRNIPSTNSIASDYLLDITNDEYGNIWIGSEYAGIVKVVQSGYNIDVVRPEEETSIGKNNNVRSVFCDSSSNIWVGTKNGNLYLYDKTLRTKKLIQNEINPYVITQAHENNIWVGTKGQGLYCIDNKTHQIKSHFINSSDVNSISHNTIFTILVDKQKRMWIGSFGGGLNLMETTEKGTAFTRFFYDTGNLSYIRYLLQDKNGLIWMATSDGIIRFNPDELINNPNAYVNYKMDLTNEQSIGCNDIKTIFEDHVGNIWVGTVGGGISKYIPQSGTTHEHFITYSSENGLAGNVVSGIMEDSKQNLWISTENGISKMENNSNTILSYKFSDKTYGNHFNENANTISKDGRMIWGSLDGLLILNPTSFVPNENLVPVTLTNFLIHNQIINAGKADSPLSQSVSYAENIKLNYTQNTFTIEFASLDLTDPTKNKYSYKLENFDKEWSNISNTNNATYKNLPYGNYVFNVRGTNVDGIWNPSITKLKISITPPFWLSWYAILIYSIIALGTLYVISRFVIKLHALQNNIKLEKELTGHKLRFFTNISHEFRTPLTLIRGAVENLNAQKDISPRIKKQIDLLNRNSNSLTRLIDQLLEFRKLEGNVLQLNLEKTDIIAFSDDIFNSFQEIAEQKNISYSFEQSHPSFMLFIDKKKIDKILYNLLSNAFKFTPKNGEIVFSINIDQAKQTCLIHVKDNGIGVDSEKQHLLFSRFMQINFSSAGTGVGLSLVKEFIDAHKGKVWHEDNKPKGSVFLVELSTNPAIYSGENFIQPTNAEETDNQSLSDKVVYPSTSNETVELPQNYTEEYRDFTILIIDDNDDIRNFLHDEFKAFFNIETAENGKEGLDKALELNPYLIVCDVMMPEMDGFEVTRRLRENFNTSHIPIVLLTAHSSIEHQLEGIQSGADAYVMKPFSLNYLSARIFKLIEQREQLKKRFSNEFMFDGNLITSTDKDQKFIELIDQILEDNIADSTFSVDTFAELAQQKRTLFYKKVKGITGLSPNELIKTKRLKLAAKLLLENNLTVSEIAYEVGFDDPFYFSKCFKTQYNCSPSKYGKTNEN